MPSKHAWYLLCWNPWISWCCKNLILSHSNSFSSSFSSKILSFLSRHISQKPTAFTNLHRPLIFQHLTFKSDVHQQKFRICSCKHPTKAKFGAYLWPPSICNLLLLVKFVFFQEKINTSPTIKVEDSVDLIGWKMCYRLRKFPCRNKSNDPHFYELLQIEWIFFNNTPNGKKSNQAQP